MIQSELEACNEMLAKLDAEISKLQNQIDEMKRRLTYSSMLGTLEWKASYKNISTELIGETLGHVIGDAEYKQLYENEVYCNLRIKKCNELKDMIKEMMNNSIQ